MPHPGHEFAGNSPEEIAAKEKMDMFRFGDATHCLTCHRNYRREEACHPVANQTPCVPSCGLFFERLTFASGARVHYASDDWRERLRTFVGDIMVSAEKCGADDDLCERAYNGILAIMEPELKE